LLNDSVDIITDADGPYRSPDVDPSSTNRRKISRSLTEGLHFLAVSESRPADVNNLAGDVVNYDRLPCRGMNIRRGAIPVGLVHSSHLLF
jgi:hypothetical protein